MMLTGLLKMDEPLVRLFDNLPHAAFSIGLYIRYIAPPEYQCKGTSSVPDEETMLGHR